MFKNAFKVFTLFGFTVRVDPSWLIIGVLITWSLAAGIFPQWHPGLETGTYWLMGLAGAIGLFFSIVWHEFCHSIVARHYGLPISGITLFIFGGVAEMEDEPATPKSEFLMALAGPVSSVILGVVLLGITALLRALAVPESVTMALFYLGFINIVLAVFNMIPGFPLDGGRLLRAALWHWRRDMRKATKTAAAIGSGIGTLFIILGVLSLISGLIIGGIWYGLIGLFLRGAAANSYRQLLMRQALGNETVGHFMTENPIVAEADLPLNEFVEDYVYRHHHRLFPVLDNEDRLIGYITTRRLKEIPVSEWSKTTVGDCMIEPSSAITISPEANAMNALKRMNRSRNSRLLVTNGQRVLGIISLKDLLGYFSLKNELEEAES